MKFFTMAWWGSEPCKDTLKIFEEYTCHLQRIRNLLPSDLLTLQESVSLHDSRLRELTLDSNQKNLHLRLDGDDGNGGLRKVVAKDCAH